MEEWKNIEWYWWRYKINKEWVVVSLHKFWEEKIVWVVANSWYKVVDLSIEWIKKRFLTHRLVALHFIPNPNNYPIVLHLDNNPLNCHMDNLKWWTLSDNSRQMYKEWRWNNYFKENHPKPNKWKFWSNHPRARTVKQYDLDWTFIKEWWSAIEAGNELNINRKNIISCCRKVKHHSRAWKYRWEYSV